MTRISSLEAARIKGGDCTGLQALIVLGAVTGAWEISLFAYVASSYAGCN